MVKSVSSSEIYKNFRFFTEITILPFLRKLDFLGISQFAMTCALRWGVTHVGNYHYWALLTLSRDHYFRYRECTGGRLSLEAAF